MANQDVSFERAEELDGVAPAGRAGTRKPAGKAAVMCYLPFEVLQALKDRAARTGTTRTWIIERALRPYLGLKDPVVEGTAEGPQETAPAVDDPFEA